MTEIYQSLDAVWHEAFSTHYRAINIQNLKPFGLRGEQPGFWFTTDKDGQYMRCGIHRNISEKMNQFEALPSEDKIHIHLSWWANDLGFDAMKRYKQEFRRKLKIYN